MSYHPLTSPEIQRYCQNEHKFKHVYSRNNLPNILKDEAYIVTLNEYESTETHRVSLYVNDNNVTYFDSFGVEPI